MSVKEKGDEALRSQPKYFPDAVVAFTQMISINPHKKPVREKCVSHFTDEETEGSQE